MKRLGFQVYHRQFFVRHFAANGVLPMVQPAGDAQAYGGGRCGNQTHNGFIIPQRLSPPVGGDKGKQPVFHLVPLAGARRKMAHQNRQTRCISQFLQPHFPRPQAIPITTPAVSGDHQALGLRVQSPAFRAPPAPNRSYRKSTRVMIGAYVDESFILRQIIDPIRIGPRYGRVRKVMAIDIGGRFGFSPLAPLILKVSDQLLLLGSQRCYRNVLILAV